MRVIKVAMVGNPNTGKTSLMNALLGLHMHVGNWPGKTVEKRSGLLHAGGRVFEITDLPGTYAVDAFSEEEIITRDVLRGEVDLVLQVVDVNALERNLLLALQVLALAKDRPVVLAFNFNEEARRRGAWVDTAAISRVLQLPIVEIEAHTGKNMDGLMQALQAALDQPQPSAAHLPALAHESVVQESGDLRHREALAFIHREVLPHYRAPELGPRHTRLDDIVFSRRLALPLLFAVMFLMFQATFSIAKPIVDFCTFLFARMGEQVSAWGFPPPVQSFVQEGLINGLGTVVSFTPLIFIMFAMIAALEDSGFLARIVIAVDRFFQACGLSGRSFVPMVLGFGCNVPAVLAARTIRNRRERLIAIAINPLMSCSARLPVYLLFAPIFFRQSWALVVIGLYAFGVVTAFVASLVLCRLIPEGECSGLVLELPPYRVPRLFNIFNTAWHQTVQFLRKAGSFIFGVIVLIWLLANLPAGVAYGSADSFVGVLGKYLAPVLAPLGFGHWIFAVSLFFGFAAKEVIIGALGTLYGASGTELAAVLPQHITPIGAISLMLFVLLYAPCLGTMAAVRQESGSWRFTLAQAGVSLILAWVVSFIFFQTASFVTG